MQSDLFDRTGTHHNLTRWGCPICRCVTLADEWGIALDDEMELLLCPVCDEPVKPDMRDGDTSWIETP